MDFPYLVKWTCIKYLYQTESVAQNISNNFLQNSLQESTSETSLAVVWWKEDD